MVPFSAVSGMKSSSCAGHFGGAVGGGAVPAVGHGSVSVMVPFAWHLPFRVPVFAASRIEQLAVTLAPVATSAVKPHLEFMAGVHKVGDGVVIAAAAFAGRVRTTATTTIMTTMMMKKRKSKTPFFFGFGVPGIGGW